MNNKLDKIAARRVVLIERAAHQRAELEALCVKFKQPAALFDKGYAVASKVRAHPGIAMGAATVLALILIKRGLIGKLAGFAVKTARVAVPVARFWLSRK